MSHGHHCSRVQGPPGPRAAQGRVGAGRVERRPGPPNSAPNACVSPFVHEAIAL